MALQGWPTSADLCASPEFKQLCGSLSIDDQEGLAEQAIAAVITEWQRRTGFYPFLVARDGSGNDVDTSRTFDPPGPQRGPVGPGAFFGIANVGGSRRLMVQGGFLSITTLTTGVTPTSTGTVLTANRDYWIRPQNADAQGKPFTYVEFAGTQYGNPSSIVIVGKWGFTNAIDGTVFRAILRGAAAESADAGVLARFGGLKGFEEASVKESYSENPHGDLIVRLATSFEKAVTSPIYKKVVIA